MFKPQARPKAKQKIDQTTGGNSGWPRGYVSTLDGSLTPGDALTDMTNMDMVQVAHPRTRPPLIKYGSQPLGLMLGRENFTKTVNGKPQYWEISIQVVNCDALQNLAITGSPTGGTFTLAYDGQTTAAIAYNASVAVVQAALEALSNIEVGDVVCEGGPLPGLSISITFEGNLAAADVDLMTANGTGLTGGSSPMAVVSETAPGGQLGVVHIRKDGEVWVAPDNSVRYDPEAQVSFAQAANRVIIANGKDNLSWYDIQNQTVTPYVGISEPASATATPAAIGGSGETLYYWVTAINGSGETLATAATPVNVTKSRNDWNGSSEYMTLACPAVEGADGYVWYVGQQPGSDKAYYLTKVYDTTFKDTGKVAATPLRRPPLGNSTAAPKLTWVYSRNGTVFGLGDVDNPSYLWKDAGPLNPGDFFAGYVGIDYGGPSVPAALKAFRTGKGDPAVTVLTQGPPEHAKMYHVVYNLQDFGGETVEVPEVQEANGHSGTIAPRGVIEIDNDLVYPTGEDFKSNGSPINIPNILATKSLSQWIEPDMRGLNLSAMSKCVGVAFRNRGYWAVPYISDENNEIWIRDNSRKGIWILRWKVPAKDIWTHQDNSGRSHLCVLVDNKTLEFDFNYSTPGRDDGNAFTTRLAGMDDPYGRSSMGLAAVYKKRFKVLRPKGSLSVSITGEGKGQPINIPATSSSSVSIPATGWGQFEFGQSEWGEDPGVVEAVADRFKVVPVRVRKKFNELRWEITTVAGGDYTLAETHTEGIVINDAYVD